MKPSVIYTTRRAAWSAWLQDHAHNAVLAAYVLAVLALVFDITDSWALLGLGR